MGRHLIQSLQYYYMNSFIYVFSQDDKMLTERLKNICESLVVNNRNTANFKTLIRLLLEKADFEKLEADEKYVYFVFCYHDIMIITTINYYKKEL